jgi:hypothetical protein
LSARWAYAGAVSETYVRLRKRNGVQTSIEKTATKHGLTVKEARVILGFDNAPSTLDLTIAFSEAR